MLSRRRGAEESSMRSRCATEPLLCHSESQARRGGDLHEKPMRDRAATVSCWAAGAARRRAPWEADARQSRYHVILSRRRGAEEISMRSRRATEPLLCHSEPQARRGGDLHEKPMRDRAATVSFWAAGAARRRSPWEADARQSRYHVILSRRRRISPCFTAWNLCRQLSDYHEQGEGV